MEGLEVIKGRKGSAVRATRAYKKGDFIHRFAGKTFTLSDLGKFNLDAFRMDAVVDPLQIGALTYMRLSHPSIDFNHSCEPNMGVRKKCELFALRDIKKGEELSYDYATTIDESFTCKCGAKKCRRAIGDFFALPKHLKEFYFEQGALPDFIRHKLIEVSEGKCPCGSGKKYATCHGGKRRVSN